MIVLHPGQIEVLQRDLRPNSIPRWHQLTNDGGVHAMRVRLDAKERWCEYSICAPGPKVRQCEDVLSNERGLLPESAVRWEIHHGNVHYGVGGLIVAQGGSDVSMDITSANGERLHEYAFSIDLMRLYSPGEGTWVPFDFGVFTNLLPLRVRFELTCLPMSLAGGEQTLDFLLVTRIAPPHHHSPNLPETPV